MPDARVYVGNLPPDIREQELEDVFYKFGRIRHIDIKVTSRPGAPAFAFIEFDDPRDAEDAVHDRDGREYFGARLRVELSRGGRRERQGPNPFGSSRRTQYRVVISNLPASCSWQDLKDFMRKAGEVTFTQVQRDGDRALGIADYNTAEDMDTAIRKLDDTEFRNSYDSAYVRVREDRARDERSGGGHGRNRSRSPVRSRSRSPTPVKRRDRSVSRERSPRRDRSVSPQQRSPRKRTPSPRDSPRRQRSPSPRG